MDVKISEQPKLLKELAEGLTQAAGACSQLTHALQDPLWMDFRETLEMTQERVMKVATFEARKTIFLKPA